MEINVLWTDRALNDLEQIFEYFNEVAGVRVARKLISDIIIKTDVLKRNPRIGQRQELLSDLPIEHHYLVQGNYKVVYWIELSSVHVATVFDCRQNPSKMKSTLK